jgi:hypothetical protein
MITKHATVMTRHTNQHAENYVYFEHGESTEEERTDGYYMTLDMFEQMGKPDIISVEVVPGDSLNLNPEQGIEAINRQIDRLHGPGASAALDAAIADGSIFND